MPKLKTLKPLETALEKLQSCAEATREALEEKRSWLDEKSDTYQESDKGQEWAEHLDAVESFLDEIDSLEFPE